MMMNEVADNQDHQLQPQHHHHDDDPHLKFLGLNVSPQQPKTVTFRERIRIVQATLGERCNDKGDSRAMLIVKCRGKSEVVAASLRLRRKEMHNLSLQFDGPDHVTFSVLGSYDIHLMGYSFNDEEPVISTEIIFDDDDQPSDSIEGQTFGTNLGSVPELNATSDHVPPLSINPSVVPEPNATSQLPLALNIPTMVHGHGMTPNIANVLENITMNESFNILLKGVTKAQIEAFVQSMDGKLQGTNLVRRMLDYQLENEAKGKEEDDSHGTTAQVLVRSEEFVHSEECEVNKTMIERQGSPEYHVYQSKKSKKPSKRKKSDDEVDCQDDHISTCAPLDSGHGLSEDQLVGMKKPKRSRKSKKKEVAKEEVTNKSQDAEDGSVVSAVSCQSKR